MKPILQLLTTVILKRVSRQLTLLTLMFRTVKLVQINFPNDSYLNEDRILYADIDEDRNATVEDGKTYEIQTDN